MTLLRLYASPAISAHRTGEVLQKLKSVSGDVVDLKTELCYHVELEKDAGGLHVQKVKVLQWILSSPLRPHSLKNETVFSDEANGNKGVIECGPRFNFSTADSSNAVQICQSVGLHEVVRLEVSKRYLISLKTGVKFTSELFNLLAAVLHDRMTECIYTEENTPRQSFNEGLPKNLEPWFTVPLLKQGKKAMEDVNSKLGLAFDEWDIDFYTDLFVNKLKRNPTSVECFDLAQSNSEHSRHWFFKGKIVLDGKEFDESLIDIIAGTQKTSNDNNVIKFGDNSSAIKGFKHYKLTPSDVANASKVLREEVESDIIFTAETHNMPTGVAPFSGATTGTGGRIRDVQGVGRGGHTVAGTAGYSVGNLFIPGYEMPWEERTWKYPHNFASPLSIIIAASDGASDYGNKFGEPLITGFVNSYGLKNAADEREEFIKPIMFSGGIGYMPHDMIKKNRPDKGMLIVKLGGPVYRIGVGGGAASSVAVQGGSDRSDALDFGAVQRGDAEMGNRLNRAVRGCLEAKHNPIQAIHDQGAGGNGNVLKELVEPEGAIIFSKEFKLGDPTITTLELWGAEYQENDAILCSKQDRQLVENICDRERCPVSFVGEVTGDGYVSLIEDSYDHIDKYMNRAERVKNGLPFDLDLEAVLGNMPRKTFDLTSGDAKLKPLSLPKDITVESALDRVLRLVAVGSKRYLTNKVDRCVTGLVAQQQCVGPLHTPLADYALIGLSFWGVEGAATSIGTQCLKGLISPEAGGRMTLAEAITNLVFAGISDLRDVKCSGNWMWPGKTGKDGALLVRACKALCNGMAELGVAVDGGKDSMSMKARVNDDIVKSPGTLVVSTYAPCPDITVKVDPALKCEGSVLLWVPITPGKYRLGGSALAQCYKQQGDSCADADDMTSLKNAFNVTQALLKGGKILSGHDISDGGLITCILEMSIGGIRGVQVNLELPKISAIEALFSEEVGLVLEVSAKDAILCQAEYKKKNVSCINIGTTVGFGMASPVKVTVNGKVVLDRPLLPLFRMWEETSYRLELLQANSEYVEEEWRGLDKRVGPTYKVTFNPLVDISLKSSPVCVAVIREEGINGDREMIASLMKAQFEVYDVTMNDLLQDKITLDRFRGVIFPGGFSYADTLGSAKGWAAGILFSERLHKQFNHFAKVRKDTFSLGVCNGCQLMGLLGWINPKENCSGNDLTPQIMLDHNGSERFECRWSTVKICEPSKKNLDQNVWLSGMDGSVLGVWVAHGEGKFTFANDSILESVRSNGQVAVQYVDDSGTPTEEYPMNPNGSPYGIAGVTSVDGRHLAMMPHPERCILNWQCPHPMTKDSLSEKSPWQKMFNNAHVWAANHK